MKVLGLITEYNPFHNGHKYHLEESKKITRSDYVVVVMSGSFTQQGNIAIYDKYTRARLAIENGADLVIELPTIYASASAEFFSHAAVNLLDKIGIVDSICFGSEAKNIDDLERVAKTIIDLKGDFWDEISNKNKQGVNFAKAREETLQKYLDADLIKILSGSNNILGIEYIKALKILDSRIKGYNLQRGESEHLDETIDDKKMSSSSMVSATSIRKVIWQNNKDAIIKLKKFVPDDTYNIIQKNRAVFNEDFFKVLKYIITSMSLDELRLIREVTEGLEYRLKESIISCESYLDLVKKVKSKRYVESKIKRMLINILLDIRKDTFIESYSQDLTYANLLAVSTRGKLLLSKISKSSKVPVISKLTDDILKNMDENTRRLVDIDIKATNIHSILDGNDLNLDYTKNIEVKKVDNSFKS